jgi:BMFP domain-containing protein YqiC
MPSSEHAALEKRVAALEGQLAELGSTILKGVLDEPGALDDRLGALERRLASLEVMAQDRAPRKRAPRGKQ